MKMKCILPFVCGLMLLFTACGEAASRAKGALAYWESFVQDIPEGEYEAAGTESFTFAQNGYSIEFVVDKWAATRGTGDYTMHPASSEVPIPAQKTSDGVIPFTITATTTTQDDTFTTEYRVTMDCNRYYNAEIAETHNYYLNCAVYTCELSLFESQKQEKMEYHDRIMTNRDAEAREKYLAVNVPRFLDSSWRQNGGNSLDTAQTATGESHIILGYYVIKDYYSPDYPNGNTDMLLDGGAQLWIRAWFEGAANDSEYIAFTVLEK